MCSSNGPIVMVPDEHSLILSAAPAPGATKLKTHPAITMTRSHDVVLPMCIAFPSRNHFPCRTTGTALPTAAGRLYIAVLAQFGMVSILEGHAFCCCVLSLLGCGLCSAACAFGRKPYTASRQEKVAR